MTTTSAPDPSIWPQRAGAESPERRRQILAAQLDLICEVGIWQQASLIALGGFLAWFLAASVDRTQLAWFLIFTVAAAAGQGIIVMLRRRAAESDDPQRWLRLFTLAAFVAGVAWGAAGYHFLPRAAPGEQMLLAFLILGQATLSVAVGAWYLPCLVAFLIPALVPTAFGYFTIHDGAHAATGAAALVFTLLLTGVGYALNLRFWDHVARQLEDHERIERLLTGRASENVVQQWLETALETMSEALAVFDADDRLVICNSRFLGEQRAGRANSLVGIGFEALVRRDIHKAGIVNAAGREEEYVAERIAYHRSKVGVFEIELRCGRWLQVRDLPTSGGGTVVVQTDITAHKQAEDKLRAAKEKAERASRGKSELLANTSHELRTPLNAIIGFSEIMEGQMFGPIGNERYLEYTRDIRKSGQFLVKVIDDLLDLSKIEAGRLDPADDIVDLGRLIATAVNITQTQAKSGGLSVKVAIPSDLPRLRADQRMTQQVILNLLSNAIKFTPNGGVINVTSMVERTGDLIVRVEDDGIGMSSEDLVRAFEPFGRAQGAMIRNFEGTGLGLPLSRSLMNLHGGFLELESEPNVGTVAIMRFPASRVHKGAVSETAESPTMRLKTGSGA